MKALPSRWSIIKPAGNVRGHPMVLAECLCGTIKAVRLKKIQSGESKSCGCLRKELGTKHGFTAEKQRPPEFDVWNMMIQRCTNQNVKNYRDYGGRGISFDPRWRSFVCFINDIGFRPSKHHSLERVDNSKGYCKENCKWETRNAQSRNKRNNRIITAKGVSKCLQDWANDLGVRHTTIIARIKNGWPEEDAVTIGRNERYLRKNRTND
jgi:hypothetical protein